MSVLPATHTILLYRHEEDFLASMVPFVQGGIDAGEGVIAVAAPENLRALRGAIGRTPPSVRFVDSADWYSRPPDTMGRWVSFALDQLAVGRSAIRVMGEVFWPDDPLFQLEMRRFEAAATLAFDSLPTLVVCPYKKTRYSRAVIDAALSAHPGVIEDGVASLSPTHVHPAEMVRATLPELRPPVGETERRFELFDVVELASFVEGEARRARLDERRVQQLMAAVCELAANAFVHADSPVYVTTWVEDGQLICQLEDEGSGIGDPGVGYQPPYAGDERWGLWLARRRSDLLEVGWSTRGNVVRLRGCATSPPQPDARTRFRGESRAVRSQSGLQSIPGFLRVTWPYGGCACNFGTALARSVRSIRFSSVRVRMRAARSSCAVSPASD